MAQSHTTTGQASQDTYTHMQRMMRQQYEQDYQVWLGQIEARYLQLTRSGTLPLFTTDTADIWPLYLESLPPSERQYHNCNACRHFLRRYGTLVMIDPQSGVLTALLWDRAMTPPLFRFFVETVTLRCQQSTVTGVFYDKRPIWGQPVTGPWRHLAIGHVAPQHQFQHPTLSAGQVSAEKTEDYKTVKRALAEFSLPVLYKTLALLDLDTFYRKEHVTAQARWLTELQDRVTSTPGEARQSLLWRSVATAPAGFCHPRSSMLGTLLDDVVAGRSLSAMSESFRKKMHPLQYQRPQAPPKAGNFDRAEFLFAQLDLALALQRRFATRADIEAHALWTPSHTWSGPSLNGPSLNAVPGTSTPTTGVFAHLRSKSAPSEPWVRQQAETQTMTWIKFRDTMLLSALSISVYVPRQDTLPLAALVTAVDMTAPPILQWDTPTHRNPVSWYLYHGGSLPESWGLQSENWYPVSCMCVQPNQWRDEEHHAHNGKGVFFLIDGAEDKRTPGVCLFPEILKSELREVRSVIEAYSKQATIQKIQRPACGLLLQQAGLANGRWRPELWVQTTHYQARVHIDRWD